MADSSNRLKTIKLYCPSLSKIAKISALEGQKLDLGTISRVFGIEPSTLKLNGHFISRGVDLIASSVTWKSLISFFSARGLSTGIGESGALIVDGKLSKCGTKRIHEPAEFEYAERFASLNDEKKKPWHDDVTLLQNKKLKDSSAVQTTESTSFGSKRTHRLDNISPFKRSKLEGTCRYKNAGGLEGPKATENSGSTAKLHGYAIDVMKRTREEEMLVATCKRAR